MLSILPVVLSAALFMPTSALSREALLTSPTRHVRTTNGYVQRLLREGLDRSPTFRAIVTRLESSDVIVYIETVESLPPALAGRLVLLPIASTQRYLRIQITTGASPNELISLIGHELRHALEVAEAPEVRDDSGMIELYRRIGERGRAEHLFDTLAAQAVGKRVRHELLA